LHILAGEAQNTSVRHRATQFLVTARFLLVMAAVATSCFADLQASAAAMACCAKTDYTCARMSGPDDCCQHMGHVVPAAPAGLTASFRLLQPAISVNSPVAADATLVRLDSPDVLAAFKRPHDPPHLHTHILLI
jgi:hypothetical protein